MDDSRLNAIVDAVVKELLASGTLRSAAPTAGPRVSPAEPNLQSPISNPQSPISNHQSPITNLQIDLEDPTLPALRYRPGVSNPRDPEALHALIASTTARVGVGRAGPRYRTRSLLLFQSDHAITQDALMRDVDPRLLDEMGFFSVRTKVQNKQEYLLRPDLGRQLTDEAKRAIAEKCAKGADVQIAVGDGLSAAAIEANLRQILPVIRQGCQSAGLSLGTPFFIQYCRVGMMNDIGDLLQPGVVVLLIGERPGLGRADSMSAYMAYRPKAGDTDADRDVVCNIFENGGTNPLEAGAFVLQTAQKMIRHGASGVRLRLAGE